MDFTWLLLKGSSAPFSRSSENVSSSVVRLLQFLLCCLNPPRFPLFAFHPHFLTVHGCFVLPKLIIRTRAEEWDRKVEGISTVEHSFSSMIRPDNYAARLASLSPPFLLTQEQIKLLGVTCPRFYATLNFEQIRGGPSSDG